MILKKVGCLPALFAGLLLFIHITEAEDADNSAIVIDLGTEYLKVGVIGPGRVVELLKLNGISNTFRNMIAFDKDSRLFGDDAINYSNVGPETSYPFLPLCLGKKYGDPALARYKRSFPYALIGINETRNAVFCEYEKTTLHVETVVGMVLKNAKLNAEKRIGRPIKNAIITIPIFFSQAERRAVAAAAKIAELNVLKFIYEGTASAVSYASLKFYDITLEPTYHLFYDMGSSKTIATIVKINLEKGEDNRMIPTIQTVGYGYDRQLGGHEVTLQIRERYLDIFNAVKEPGQDLTSSSTAMRSLLNEADRIKHILTRQLYTFGYIKSYVHRHYMGYSMALTNGSILKITRDELDEMIDRLEKYMCLPITKALKMAKLSMSNIRLAEISGGATRTPRIFELVKKCFVGYDTKISWAAETRNAIGAIFYAANILKPLETNDIRVIEEFTNPIYVHYLYGHESSELQPARVIIYSGSRSHLNRSMLFTAYRDNFTLELKYKDGQNHSFIEVTGYEEAVKKGITNMASFMKLKQEFDDWENEQLKLGFDFYEDENHRVMIIRNATQESGRGEEYDGSGNDYEHESSGDEMTIINGIKRASHDWKYRPISPTSKTAYIPLKVNEIKTDFNDLTDEEIEEEKTKLEAFEKKEKEKTELKNAIADLRNLADFYEEKLTDQEYASHLFLEEKKVICTHINKVRNWLNHEANENTDIKEYKKRFTFLSDILYHPDGRPKAYMPRQAAATYEHAEAIHALALVINKNFHVLEDKELTKFKKLIDDYKQNYHSSEKGSEYPDIIQKELDKINDKIKDYYTPMSREQLIDV
ncbi:unnamed protein product [Caenorhabditis bovis]|uniref:Hypoxia up-regulated protein 1 n=1 Tax=Caenorhabditis bovis TaxID=2654633 RepID=A0A8S1EJP9_9PELO|nr:unnamed protein product [Caenorhabditis bovis]